MTELLTLTWGQLDHQRLALASGLIELGLDRHERVNILSNTSMKWMIADLAIQSCGGETVPIYQSNLPREVEYIVNDCGAQAFITTPYKAEAASASETRTSSPSVQVHW